MPPRRKLYLFVGLSEFFDDNVDGLLLLLRSENFDFALLVHHSGRWKIDWSRPDAVRKKRPRRTHKLTDELRVTTSELHELVLEHLTHTCCCRSRITIYENRTRPGLRFFVIFRDDKRTTRQSIRTSPPRVMFFTTTRSPLPTSANTSCRVVLSISRSPV